MTINHSNEYAWGWGGYRCAGGRMSVCGRALFRYYCGTPTRSATRSPRSFTRSAHGCRSDGELWWISQRGENHIFKLHPLLDVQRSRLCHRVVWAKKFVCVSFHSWAGALCCCSSFISFEHNLELHCITSSYSNHHRYTHHVVFKWIESQWAGSVRQ